MVTREMPMYNLDMIISVGYRVNSKRGVKFRQWANRILKEYLVKDYAVNDRLRRDQLGELRQLVQVVGSPRTTRSATATSASPPPCSFGSSTITASSIVPTDQASGGQHPRGSYADDSREPHGGKGRDGEGGSEFDK